MAIPNALHRSNERVGDRRPIADNVVRERRGHRGRKPHQEALRGGAAVRKESVRGRGRAERAVPRKVATIGPGMATFTRMWIEQTMSSCLHSSEARVASSSAQESGWPSDET